MKKSTKIIIAVIAIVWLTVIASVVGVVISSVNKEKSSITAEQFKTTLQGKGFFVSDTSSQFSQYTYIKQPYVALSSGYTYQIEFYELTDESFATSFYNNNVSILQSNKGSTSAETNANGKNFSKYTLSSADKYQVVSRVDNTVIYLNVDSNYKDEVKNILDELGY